MSSSECSLSPRFKLKEGLIVVITSENEAKARATKASVPITFVRLGSSEHSNALQERIAELKIESSDSKELQKRQVELEFITNLKKELQTDSESIGSKELLTSHDTLEENSQDEIHVTSETFGQLGKFKNISVSEGKDVLYRNPKIRQYFENGILHREHHHMKVTWYELFVDLIYVGAVAKAGHLISESWSVESFGNFALVFVSIFMHWVRFNIHNNQIYHEDLLYKVVCFLNFSCLIVMSANITFVFYSDFASNTASIFLFAQSTSVLIMILVWAFVCCTNAKFTKAIGFFGLSRCLFSFPFYVAASVMSLYRPHFNLAIILWILGIAFEILIVPIAGLLQSTILAASRIRMGVNIEHFTERHGLWMVIVMGEVVVGFLVDNNSKSMTGNFYSVACFLISTCFYWLYFRAETSSHFQHAIRRHWLTGISWSLIHVPLSMSFVVLGVSISALLGSIYQEGSKFISKAELPPGALPKEVQSMYCLSVMAIHFSLAVMGLLHQEAKPGTKLTANVSKNIRIVSRVIVGALFLGLAFVQMSSESLILLLAGFGTIEVILEEYGRLVQ